MAEKKREEKIKNLIAVMKKERGYMPAQWAYMAEKDVDFMEAYNNLYNKALTDGKALSAKTREFVAIGILAYRGLTDGVYNHVKRALQLGATKQELLEAIETLLVPGGAPAFGTGLRAFMQIEEKEKRAHGRGQHEVLSK